MHTNMKSEEEDVFRERKGAWEALRGIERETAIAVQLRERERREKNGFRRKLIGSNDWD